MNSGLGPIQKPEATSRALQLSSLWFSAQCLYLTKHITSAKVHFPDDTIPKTVMREVEDGRSRWPSLPHHRDGEAREQRIDCWLTNIPECDCDSREFIWLQTSSNDGG